MVDTTSVNNITSVGQPSGVEKTLPSYIGPYVNTMLGKGAAVANQPYQGYKGQISAGYSDLQNQAFQGLANLTVPTGQMGAYQPRSFTGQTPQIPGAQQPMNPMMSQPMNSMMNQPQNQGMGLINTLGQQRPQGMGANIAGSNPMMGASMMPQSLSMSEEFSDDPMDFMPQQSQAERDAQIEAQRVAQAERDAEQLRNPTMYTSGGTQAPSLADQSLTMLPGYAPPSEYMPDPYQPPQRPVSQQPRTPLAADNLDMAKTNMAVPATTPPQGQGIAQQYMNPYLQASLEPQIAEARRQADISRNANAGRLTRAGAFGGGRQAIMESEGQRNMLRNVADVTAKGYNSAYDQARRLFESEEARFRTGQEDTNKFGRDTLNAQMIGGNKQREIEKEGITADMDQFNLERDDPYKKLMQMQSLMTGLPMSNKSTGYIEPSTVGKVGGNTSDIMSILKELYG